MRSSYLSLLLFLFIAAFPHVAGADDPKSSEFIFGQSVDGYQKAFDRLVNEGLRPITLQADEVDGEAVFHGLFQNNHLQADWMTRHSMSVDEFQKELAKSSQRGFRPTSVTAARQGDEVRLGAIWVRDGGLRPFEVCQGLTASELRQTAARLEKKGLRPETVTGYSGRNGVQFVALFVDGAGQTAEWKLDLTAEEARSFASEIVDKGMRPISISSYGKTPERFAIVAVRDNLTGNALFDIAEDKITEEITRQEEAGLLVRSATLSEEGGRRYALVVEKPADELPMTGEPVPALAAFDKAMQEHMRHEHLRGATLAIVRDKELLLSRGYGFKDAEEREPMPADAILRIASVAKPITVMAVQKLIDEGKLQADTKVREYLGIEPPEGATVDPRWNDLTVNHLILHKGGWDRGEAQPGYEHGFDPMFYPELIGKTLDAKPPLNAEHFTRYMLGRPLQFDPGSKRSYSNFGYCVLGRVVEKASGMSYGDYITKELCGPLGLTDISLGHSLITERSPREPVYRASGTTNNVLTTNDEERVRWPDGGFLLEAMDSHGGIIGSAPHLAKLFDEYWMDGERRLPGQSARWVHFGSLPGTFSLALQRADGLTIVVLFNQRSEAEKKEDERILNVMEEAAEAIQE